MNDTQIARLQPDEVQSNGTVTRLPTARMAESASLISMIASIAADPNLDISRLERLIEMRDKLARQEAQIAFDAAFALMQPELPVIDKKGRIEGQSKKTGENLSQPFGRWEDISPAITPILAKHGFGIRFRQEKVVDPSGTHQTRVTCILSHAMGHREEPYIDLPLDTSGSKNNVQAYGSTISYGKRYSATMALNIVTKGEDDDGRAAGTDMVTDEQVQEINLLMTATKANLQGFLAFFKIAALDQLPAKRFDEAIGMLNAKKAKGAQP